MHSAGVRHRRGTGHARAGRTAGEHPDLAWMRRDRPGRQTGTWTWHNSGSGAGLGGVMHSRSRARDSNSEILQTRWSGHRKGHPGRRSLYVRGRWGTWVSFGAIGPIRGSLQMGMQRTETASVVALPPYLRFRPRRFCNLHWVRFSLGGCAA
jgi:hypothetical protein